MTAAGVAALYLSTFAGFGYYRLMPPMRGALYLSAVVALTAGLAIRYRAVGIAVISGDFCRCP